MADLAFLAIVLSLAVAMARVVVHSVRRRHADARRVARRAGFLAAAYLLLVAVTALVTPRRWIAIGEEQRFDDWAITIAGADRTGDRYRVVAQIANRGRGRPQRAADADLVLVVAGGHRFVARPAPNEPSLQSILQAGESIVTAREFDVPVGAEILGLDVIHGGWPALFLVGDRGSLFHKRPLVRLP